MSFPRHPEIYPPMEAQTKAVGAPAHRLDEFPAGYSLAGCSPAWPASASPAGYEYAVQSFCRSSIFQRTANSVLTVCVSPGGKRRCQPGIAMQIEKPRTYQKDGLPNGPTWYDVQRLVKDTEGRKPTDYRARSMVLLLAVYGLRSSEVAGLALKDFDWRGELLTINRRKGGGSRQYPLVHEVGEAVLDYLQHARPQCECRNLFVSLYPPHRAICRGVVWAIISQRFRKLGIQCSRQGPHTLRHYTASPTMPLKLPGDLFAGFWLFIRGIVRLGGLTLWMNDQEGFCFPKNDRTASSGAFE